MPLREQRPKQPCRWLLISISGLVRHRRVRVWSNRLPESADGFDQPLPVFRPGLLFQNGGSKRRVHGDPGGGRSALPTSFLLRCEVSIIRSSQCTR
jgi:hypothetical protein